MSKREHLVKELGGWRKGMKDKKGIAVWTVADLEGQPALDP